MIDIDFVDQEPVITDLYADFDDVLVVQVLDSDGAPVENVPVSFSLTSNDFGYINPSQALTNSDGYASTTFTVTQLDLQEFSNNSSFQVALDVYISELFNETKTS